MTHTEMLTEINEWKDRYGGFGLIGALTITIKKYEKLPQFWGSLAYGNGHCPDVDNCPMCRLFIRNDCRGCPLMSLRSENKCSPHYYTVSDSISRNRREEFVTGCRLLVQQLKRALKKARKKQ